METVQEYIVIALAYLAAQNEQWVRLRNWNSYVRNNYVKNNYVRNNNIRDNYVGI